MVRVGGVDGCRKGWVVVVRDLDSNTVDVRVVGPLRPALLDETLKIVAVDIPIGLLAEARPGGRKCEREARKVLGPGRSSSVFSAPARGTLGAEDYEDAKQRNRRSSLHGIAISRQCWAICEKIAEVDRVMTPALQRRVVEVHPEVSFKGMGGTQLASKKRVVGREQRKALLERAWSLDLSSVVARGVQQGAGADDVLDAMAAAWTAERVVRGVAERLPPSPEHDAKGLRMEIAW